MGASGVFLHIFQAFKIGIISVFYSYYRWVLIGSGFLMYLWAAAHQYLQKLAFGSETYKNAYRSVDIFFRILKPVSLYIIFSVGMIALTLIIIQTIVIVFDHGFEKSSLKNNWPSWNSMVSYVGRGLIVSLIILLSVFFLVMGLLGVIFPLVDFFRGMLVTGSQPFLPPGWLVNFLHLFLFAMVFVPFGFCFWALIDQHATIGQSVKQSYDLSLSHKSFLFLFYLISLGIMVLIHALPYGGIFSYSLYFPVALAAQGYLYRHYVAQNFSGFAQKVPYTRPPIL